MGPRIFLDSCLREFPKTLEGDAAFAIRPTLVIAIVRKKVLRGLKGNLMTEFVS